ncbi:sulfotransferase domain-containing protein [Coraliomargarita parva]|uniref:sulfotransferase domain-containing protein n=1 Tax=Coraliomargarita parva TaxID=3014050 RepID=UPI0022B4DB1C|nr:sulfotransferase domain-containing protein [Coraliomargarita parva]
MKKLRAIRHSYLNWDLPESVYFFSLHKCASTLFSDYILKHVDGLLLVNQSKRIFMNKPDALVSVRYRKRGHVYGPLRLSGGGTGPVWKQLVQPVIAPEFIRDKIAYVMIRDPRDILVSSYYSFGFTHPMSALPEIRVKQEERRAMIQSMSLDAYVLEFAKSQQIHFKNVGDVLERCPRAVLLRYEDMISDFDNFLEKLRRYLPIRDEVAEEIRRRSRPKDREEQGSHKRSGQVGGFRSKLEAHTVTELNRELSGILSRYGYEADT